MDKRPFRSEKPLRLVSYQGAAVTLGKLEAAYLDLLWQNRGRALDDDIACTVLWGPQGRLAAMEGNRLYMLASTLRKKVPGIIYRCWGVGNYIPNGSGILIQRGGDARRVWLYVKPAQVETPLEPPRSLFSEED